MQSIGPKLACLILLAASVGGCGHKQRAAEIVVYCGVDEPVASEIFKNFEKQTGLHVAPRYDIEASKSVGLAGRLEAERDNPRADVWWGSEAFLSARLASQGVLATYASPTAGDVQPQFKDSGGLWTGVGLRARVLAVAEGKAKPPFSVTSMADLADPRLKDRVAMSRPTAGATGANIAALYVVWGPDKAQVFFRKLQGNGIALLGGNAEVADQVGAGIYGLGLTDSDAVANSIANGGKVRAVLPDQQGEGAMAMPSTVALVSGAKHDANAKRLIDFLVSKQAEQKLIDLRFAQWSVRAGVGQGIKAMNIDYRAAADIYPRAQREATAILDNR